MATRKMKIKGAVKKRLKLTGTGKVKRERAGASHILTKKRPDRKRRLRTSTTVDPTDLPRVRKMLGK